MEDTIGVTKPELYVFGDQSVDEATKMAEETKLWHSSNPAREEEEKKKEEHKRVVEDTINPPKPPELYVFNDQKGVKELKDIKKLFQQAQKVNKVNLSCEDRDVEGNLTFDNVLNNSQCNIRLDRRTSSRMQMPDAEVGSLWRKLSGVNPTESVRSLEESNRIKDLVSKSINEQFPSLDATWEQSFYNSVLYINEAKTRINLDDLMKASESLKKITGEDSANKTIVNLVIEKLNNLFA